MNSCEQLIYNKTIDTGAGLPHFSNMDEFLEYVRRRRTKLKKELEELQGAERVYRQSLSAVTRIELLPSEVIRQIGEPRTLKEMVLVLLDEVYPGGLTALQMLIAIQERWMSNTKRWSLSPQLTRLKNDGHISNSKKIWKLKKEENQAFKALNETEAPVGTEASEQEGG